MPWEDSAPKPGEQATDLSLLDEQGRPVQLSSFANGPLVALIFGGPGDDVGLDLLRDYRDETLALRRAGAGIVGIAKSEPSALAYLRAERGLGFPLLSDPDGVELGRWSMQAEAAVLFLDRNLLVKQRALGLRLPGAALVRILRRSGPVRSTLRDRFAHALRSLSHALTPRHAR